MRITGIILAWALVLASEGRGTILEVRRFSGDSLASTGQTIAADAITTFAGRGEVEAAAVFRGDLWLATAPATRPALHRLGPRTGAGSVFSADQLRTAAPVKSLCVFDDTLYVLFTPTPTARGGLGRLKDGQWQFPVPLPGVPDSIEEEMLDDAGHTLKTIRPLPLIAVASVAGTLYVANRAGVWEGPDQWTRIVESHTHAMAASVDGAYVLALRTPDDPSTHGAPVERLRYDPASKKLSVEPLKDSRDAWAMAQRGVLDDPAADRWTAAWTRIGGRRTQGVVIGPLDDEAHRVVCDADSIWLVSAKRVIRLDRRKLDPMVRRALSE